MNAPIKSTRGHLWGFLAFAYGWTWLFWLVAALRGMTIWRPPAVVFFVIGGLGVPLGGVVMSRLKYGVAGVRDLLHRLVDPTRITARWWAVILLFFPIVTLLTATFVRVVGIEESTPDLASIRAIGTHPARFMGLMAFTLVIGPLPEEIGWRGYLLDELQTRHYAVWSALVIGVLMWVWHLPLFQLPGYSDVFHAMPATALQMLFMILSMSIFYTWIYNNTNRSVLAVILFHFMGNLSSELLRISVETQWYRLGLTGIIAVLIVWWARPPCLRRECAGPLDHSQVRILSKLTVSSHSIKERNTRIRSLDENGFPT